jgi:uncharacterized protein (DUF2267 family)
MNFDEFTGTIQHRLQLSDTGKTVRAIRATLTALGTRLPAENAADLAASMPMEIGWYLTGGPDEHGERFGWSEFVERVSAVGGVDRAEAAFHSQVVIDLLGESVPESDFEQLRDQLPHDAEGQNWGKLFGVVDAGGWNEGMEAQVGGGAQDVLGEAHGETDPRPNP